MNLKLSLLAGKNKARKMHIIEHTRKETELATNTEVLS